MGSLFGGSKSQQTSQTTQLPAWLENAGQETFAFAKDIASEPYQAYSGPRIAPLSGLEREGMGALSSAAGGFRGALSGAGGIIKGAATPWSGDAARRYMDPFVKGALDPAAREIGRTAQRQRYDRNAQAIAADAFGNHSRRAVGDALADRNELEAISDLYGRGYSEAYRGALGAFGADQGRALQAGGALADYGRMGVDALFKGGALGRADEQASYDLAYQDFLRQKGYPQEQLDLLIRAMAGVPYSRTTTGSVPVQQPSVVGQLGGLGLAAYGLFGGSDARFKQDVEEVDDDEVLARVVRLPVKSWRYRPLAGALLGDDGRRHIGPMAQDFAAEFDGDGSTVSVLTGIGALMSSVKALDRKIARIEGGALSRAA
jgi:hypothetical protein